MTIDMLIDYARRFYAKLYNDLVEKIETDFNGYYDKPIKFYRLEGQTHELFVTAFNLLELLAKDNHIHYEFLVKNKDIYFSYLNDIKNYINTKVEEL